MVRRSRDDPDAPELNRSTIVRAAIDLIDRDGLDGFSVRGLARHMGAGNMSLYHYVGDREALLVLVLDEILGSVDHRRLPTDPIRALEAVSKRFVAVFVEHPNTIPLFVLEPLYAIGPNGVDLFDRIVGLLRATGLPDREVAEATVVLVEYLCGHLIGHLPSTQGSASADVDTFIAGLPDDAAPNIRTLTPAFRRMVASPSPDAGITMILASVAQRARELVSE